MIFPPFFIIFVIRVHIVLRKAFNKDDITFVFILINYLIFVLFPIYFPLIVTYLFFYFEETFFSPWSTILYYLLIFIKNYISISKFLFLFLGIWLIHRGFKDNVNIRKLSGILSIGLFIIGMILNIYII